MELLFREAAITALNSFVAHYEEAFALLYGDSGLWNEAAIIEGFKQSAKNIRDEILLSENTHCTYRQLRLRCPVRREGWDSFS